MTLAIRRDPERYPREALLSGREGLADLRWTVDTPEDLARVARSSRRLGDRRHEAGWEEILAAAGG